MSKKNKVLFALISIVLILALGVYAYFTMIYEPKEDEVEEVIPIGTEAPERGAIDSYGEVSDIEPAFLFNNKSEFADECKIPLEAKVGINEYLSHYLSYYLVIPEGDTYYGDYIKGSFKDDGALPSFMVMLHLNDEDVLVIDCYYNIALDRFEFLSDLNKD